MPTISPTLYARWRLKKHVGDAAPSLEVRVARGLLEKFHHPGGYEGLEGDKQKPYEVHGGKNGEPWLGEWRSTDPEGPNGRVVPNVLSVVWDINFQQKGLKTCVIEIENVYVKQESGAGGLFHRIIRGFFAPMFGEVLKGRTPSLTGAVPNEWNETFNNGYKVTVSEGYGDEKVRTFVGLIDNCDVDSKPDRITLTCRSFVGMTFQDQHLMGWNIPPEIDPPITFVDKEQALEKYPKRKGWVMVHDLAAVVKALAMWAGFKEIKQIHNAGASLISGPFTYHMSNVYMDVVDELLTGLNFVFYEKCPSTFSESLGIPVFEPNSALMEPTTKGLLQLTDLDMLEAVQAKFDLSKLPYIIRVRGKENSSGKKGPEDSTPRFAAMYFPPWSGTSAHGKLTEHIPESGRLGGVWRHELVAFNGFESNQECEVEAVLVALQYALESMQVSFQVAGYPGFELNQQVSLISDSTGINSRVWTSSIHSEHTTGKDAKWHMQVGGALLDTEDMQFLKQDLLEAGGSPGGSYKP